MTIKYLLDTNICIYLVKSQYEYLVNKVSQFKSGELGISIVTHGELLYGLAKSKFKKQGIESLDELTDYITVLPFPLSVAYHYAEIRSNLERTGQIIGNNDLWIASHALAADVTLVTNNIKEFNRVKKLKIENWIKP